MHDLEWARIIVYEQGGLFTCYKPSSDRSLRNYLVYRGYDLQAVFFKGREDVFMAMAGHPMLRYMQPLGRMDDISVLDFNVYFTPVGFATR